MFHKYCKSLTNSIGKNAEIKKNDYLEDRFPWMDNFSATKIWNS